MFLNVILISYYTTTIGLVEEHNSIEVLQKLYMIEVIPCNFISFQTTPRFPIKSFLKEFKINKTLSGASSRLNVIKILVDYNKQ